MHFSSHVHFPHFNTAAKLSKNFHDDIGKCFEKNVTTFLGIPFFCTNKSCHDRVSLSPSAGDLVGVNKDSYLILEKLPAEYDSRVKAMEVDARPTEEYSDIGGLDKQIQELVEAVVLPMTHKQQFENIGIHPPKVKWQFQVR